jgi:hypothetical protein
MRAKFLVILVPMLMSADAMALAQQAAPPAETAAEAPAAIAPIRSTLKPPAPKNADTSQPRQRMVTVFGTEACPKPASPDEVVVCARLPDSEIYRIPTRLREATKRVSPFQANRSLLLGDASGGAGGSIGSCSVNGPGGSIGCTRNQIDAWAHDRAGRMGASEEVPPQ